MNTHDTRGRFEKERIAELDGLIFSDEDNQYQPVLHGYLDYETMNTINAQWQGYQAAEAASAERIQELEQRLARLSERNEQQSERDKKCIAACEGVTFAGDGDFTGQMLEDQNRIQELERQVADKPCVVLPAYTPPPTGITEMQPVNGALRNAAIDECKVAIEAAGVAWRVE